MIDVKEAVQIAKKKAVEMLGQEGSLEEIEREIFKGQDAWSITLGFPPKIVLLNAIPQYKRFLIEVETGDLIAIKLRELASR